MNAEADDSGSKIKAKAGNKAKKFVVLVVVNNNNNNNNNNNCSDYHARILY